MTMVCKAWLKSSPSLECCRLVDKALSLVAEHKAEFMIASHNQESIEKATKLMYELDLPPSRVPLCTLGSCWAWRTRSPLSWAPMATRWAYIQAFWGYALFFWMSSFGFLYTLHAEGMFLLHTMLHNCFQEGTAPWPAASIVKPLKQQLGDATGAQHGHAKWVYSVTCCRACNLQTGVLQESQ